jgi:PleD family two-component response regulator
VTVSIGVAIADPARGGQSDLIRRSDAALYAAKQNGKNSVEVAALALAVGARSAA